MVNIALVTRSEHLLGFDQEKNVMKSILRLVSCWLHAERFQGGVPGAGPGEKMCSVKARCFRSVAKADAEHLMPCELSTRASPVDTH